MFDWLRDLAKAMWNGLPILGRNVRPNLACALGFLFGGIGLAIYFRTVIDLFIPVVVALVAQLIVWKAVGSVELGWLVGAIIAALYGFYRAQSSNQRREETAPDSVPIARGT